MNTTDRDASTSERTPRGEGWQATRKCVLERDGFECRFCGVSNDVHKNQHGRELSAHHIIPKNEGGPDDTKNLITVCQSCHRTLEATHAKALVQLTDGESAQTKAGVTFTVKRTYTEMEQLEKDLQEFVDGHPTFRERFKINTRDNNEGASSVTSSTLQKMIGGVSSEWAFLVTWGFIRGLRTPVTDIENWVPEAYDEDALAESDLPTPADLPRRR